MGEPLYNYRQVSTALKILTHPQTLGMGKQRVIVSTSGIVPAIRRLGSDVNVGLAIRLAVTCRLCQCSNPLMLVP